jgi:hypothetical protein
MPCDRSTPRCAGKHDCCHKILLEILDFTVEKLNSKNIPYWLTYGTLLGAVREHKMIPWDEDIDIGILINDLPSLLLLSQKFQRAGYGWGVGTNANYIVGKINIYTSLINVLHLDVSVYANVMEGNERYVEGVMWPGCRTPLDNVLPKNLIDIEFEGRTVKAPSNPGNLLENFYGPDWRTPKVKSWIKKRIKEDECRDPELLKIMENAGWYDWEPGRRLEKRRNK